MNHLIVLPILMPAVVASIALLGLRRTLRVGRVVAMLSCLSWTQVDALYPSSAELSAGHSNSPTSTTELHAMLAETRKRGWAREIDSVTVGWSTLAVPVVDVSGYPLASLATTYRTALESSQLDQALLGHLFAAARAIQYRLGAR